MILLLAVARAEDPIGPPPDFSVEPPPGSLAGGATHGIQEFRFRYYQTGEELSDFPGNPVLDYFEAVERLGLKGGNAHWTMGIQGDAVALFGNAYKLDGVLTYERDLYKPGLLGPTHDVWFAAEKLSLVHRGAQGSVELGDGYTSFGKGIALNVVNNSDIDIDTTLRGAKGVLAFGDFEIAAVTGQTNPQQVRLENPNVDILPDYPHTVNGVRVDAYGRTHVGVHGVMWQFAREAPSAGGWPTVYGQAVDAGIVGGTLDASAVGPFDLSFEGDAFLYAADEIPVDQGFFIYGSATAYVGKASILVEAKHQKDAEWINTFVSPGGYEVATGPTLEYERAITEDSSAAVNSNNLTGVRVRIDLSALNTAKQNLALYATVAGFRDEDAGGLHFNTSPESIGHVVGGLTWVAGDVHLLLNGGLRLDLRDDAPKENPGDREVHGDAAFTFPIAGPVSVELAPSVLAWHWGENPAQQDDYLDVSNALALKVGSHWAGIVYTDYSNNPLINSVGNVSDEVYMAGELQWMPTSATTIKAFYGAYRSGIRCAGGQCRQLPGFEGGRVSLTANF